MSLSELERLERQTFCEFIKESMGHSMPEFVLGSVATIGFLPLGAYLIYRNRVSDYIAREQAMALLRYSDGGRKKRD